MLKQKNGLTRAERKIMQAPKLLSMELEDLNKKALKYGFASVKSQFEACKEKLRKAREAKQNLEASLVS
jgi:hypothetical protein